MGYDNEGKTNSMPKESPLPPEGGIDSQKKLRIQNGF